MLTTPVTLHPSAVVPQRDVLTRYDLPRDVRFCTQCTMSNQRPRIRFDAEGVCSACRYVRYRNTEIDWDRRERELRALCDRFRRDDGRHDVVVPCSGGKDSSSVAHKLKHEYGMHPLSVTWSPHLYTDIGFKNLRNFIDIGGIDNILGSRNGRIHRLLTKISLEVLGDPFQPFIYGQANFPLQIATAFNIPLVMKGENGDVEYVGDIEKAKVPTCDVRTFAQHYFSGLPPEALTEYGVHRNDLAPYLPPPYETLDRIGVEVHYFGYYRPWIPQENYYYAVEHTGFTANPERNEGTYSKYASLDDKLDGFHYYLGYIKFGIGRTTSDTAHEVRDGHLTRAEGVALVHKYDGEFPQKYFREFLEYCDITEEHFWAVVDSWRSPHLWERVGGEWRLRYRVA